MNRRDFLADSAHVLGAGAIWPSVGSQRPDRPREGDILTTVKPIVRVGGPVFTDTADPVAFARAHRRLGYRAAYGPSKNVKDAATINALADACHAEDIVIAEVGRWVNLLDADPAKRRANLESDAIAPGPRPHRGGVDRGAGRRESDGTENDSGSDPEESAVVPEHLRPPSLVVRVPLGLSLLMLLVFWGTIRGKGAGAYRNVSGLEYEGYVGRWLLVSAALFAISGALYLLRRRTT